MHRSLLFLIALFLLPLFALAACETTLAQVERFDASYNVLDNGSAEATIVMVAFYPEQCLIEKWKESVDVNLGDAQVVEIATDDLVCPKEFLLNNFNRELGDFPSPLNCTTTYAQDKNHIKMTFTGITIPVKSVTDTNTTLFFGSDTLGSALPTDSSLSVTVPSSATILVHAPLTGEKLVNKIVWAPFPKSTAVLSYTLPLATTAPDPLLVLLPNLLIVIVIVVIVLIVLVAWALTHPIKSTAVPKDTLEEKKRQAADIKLKITNLEKSYLLGKLEQNAYERLNEQYQFQLNELITDIKKSEGKK